MFDAETATLKYKKAMKNVSNRSAIVVGEEFGSVSSG